MQLYDYCRSSAAYRVRIALNLKQLTYSAHSVNLVKAQQTSDEYKEVNQQGLVPTLVDGELSISQSLAICEYLEEAYPNAYALLPSDLATKTQIKMFATSIACDIHPLNNLRVLKYLMSELSTTEEQKLTWYHHWINEGFVALEKQLSKTAGKFCFGDQPSLADVFLVPQVFNAKRFKLDMTPYPTIDKIVAHCNTVQAFIDAHPDNQPDS